MGGSALVFMLVVVACAGIDNDVVTTEDPSESDPIAAADREPVDSRQLRADPIVSALELLQQNDPSLGSVVGSDLAAAGHACAGSAIVNALGADRVRELSAADGAFDRSALTSAERAEAAEELASCHEDPDLLRRLVQVDDFQLADCIVGRAVELEKVPEIIAALLAGTSVGSTSPVLGFRFSCQTSELDQLFGAHPGGTAGEDLRLMSEVLIAALIPISEMTTFEATCLTRGTMAAISIDWVWEVQAQPAQYALHPLDYLAASTDPAFATQAFDGIRNAIVLCVEPFKLYRNIVALDSVASATDVGCLRDRLTVDDLSVLLSRQLRIGVTSADDTAAELPTGISEAFVGCDFDAVPVGGG